MVAPDNNIRVEGAECAGARPFEHVHAGAAYALEAADGEVLAEGELPAGVAENADPTHRLGRRADPDRLRDGSDADGRSRARAYRLSLDEGPPLEFDAALLSDEPLGEPAPSYVVP